MKFLIDECLSTELVEIAQQLSHIAHHVTWIGKRSEKDWYLASFAIENDLVIVTNNSIDFRGAGSKPGFTTSEPIHPGLVCLNCEQARRNRSMFIQLFKIALAHIGDAEDIINKVIEVTQIGDEAEITEYHAPSLT